MNKISKKRDLIRRVDLDKDPDVDNISLSDFSEIIGKLSKEANTLELQDNLQAIKRSVAACLKLDKLSKMYRTRLRELRNEIIATRPKRSRGNTQSLNNN